VYTSPFGSHFAIQVQYCRIGWYIISPKAHSHHTHTTLVTGHWKKRCEAVSHSSQQNKLGHPPTSFWPCCLLSEPGKIIIV
jgi:hypothetical protein